MINQEEFMISYGFTRELGRSFEKVQEDVTRN